MAADEEKVGPFTELAREYGPVVWKTLADNVPRDLRWNWLLLMLVLALVIYVVRRGRGAKGADGRERACGIVEYLLPRDIYTHVSARVDVWLVIFERALKPVWALLLLGSLGPFVEKSVIGAMTAGLGAGPAIVPNLGWTLFYSFVLLLGYDFTFFLLHYSEHKIPALWAVHKVHHSAEVLTPLTRYREHVLEGPLYSMAAAIGYAVPAGVFAWLFAGSIKAITVLDIGLFTLVFGFNGAFRHYHVQFRYPRWLEKWLQSPAMHHTHHSYLPQHWDTNMSVITSVWDRLFGTLYIPAPDEYTPWGLRPEQQAECRTFRQNLTAPFRDWYQMIRSKRSVIHAKYVAMGSLACLTAWLAIQQAAAQESVAPPQAAAPASRLHYSNRWRLQVSEGADNDGVMTFRFTPKDGAPVEIPVNLRKGRGEDGCARDIRDAFRKALDKKAYKIEVDDGEDVLVKKHLGHAPDFSIQLVDSTVKGTRINFDRE